MSASGTPAELAVAIKRAIASIDALEKELGIVAPTLSPSMKRHTARYRKGGHKMISIIGSVAKQQRVDFPRLPVSAMNDQLAIADAVDALVTRVTTLQVRLGNIVFSAKASAWQAAMQYYALLRRMARGNREVAAALQPVREFMAVHDPRPKRQEGDLTRPQVRAVKKAAKVLDYPPSVVDAAIKKRKKPGT